MTRIPVSPGIDGIPTSSIPTDPQQFVTWFSSVYLKRWAANADVRNATPGTNVTIGGQLNTPGSIDVDVGITGVVEGTGLTVTETSSGVVTVGLANTAVTPGSYTNTNLTVNAEGQITAAANGSSGGIAEPFNITPDTHAVLPTGVGLGPNDEFEIGTSIDTTGGRYSGATAWTAFNASGTGGTAISNSVSQGSLVILGGTTQAGNSIKGYSQPLVGPTSSTYVAKVQSSVVGSSSGLLIDAGIFLSESATGKAVTFDIRISNSGGSDQIFVTSWSSPTTSIANLATLPMVPNTLQDGVNSFYQQPIYLQLILTATTITCGFSRSGVIGTFVNILTFTTTSHFTTAPDTIGMYLNPDIYTSPSIAPLTPLAAGIFDWFRRIA